MFFMTYSIKKKLSYIALILMSCLVLKSWHFLAVSWGNFGFQLFISPVIKVLCLGVLFHRRKLATVVEYVAIWSSIDAFVDRSWVCDCWLNILSGFKCQKGLRKSMLGMTFCYHSTGQSMPCSIIAFDAIAGVKSLTIILSITYPTSASKAWF